VDVLGLFVLNQAGGREAFEDLSGHVDDVLARELHSWPDDLLDAGSNDTL
jgi:hypothetical protein